MLFKVSRRSATKLSLIKFKNFFQPSPFSRYETENVLDFYYMPDMENNKEQKKSLQYSKNFNIVLEQQKKFN